MPRRWRNAFVLGVAAVAVSSLVLGMSDWILECHDPGGHRLGGIDCFQYNAIPKADAGPATWLGFTGWATVWAAGLITVAATAFRNRARGRPPA